MASRETTILQDKVRELQNEKTDVTMDSLFSEIDRDGNGSISKEEFGRVFSAIRDSVHEEHEKLARSKRKSAILCTAVGMLVAFLGILLAGNTGLVWWMIRLNKDIHIRGNSSQLVDSKDHVVGTSKILNVNDLLTVPKLGAKYDYSQIESIQMTVKDPELEQTGVLALNTVGSFWYNSTDMDFFLETGLTLHISQGLMRLAPTFRSASGATPSAHRRKMFIPVIYGLYVIGAVCVAVAAQHVYLGHFK
jgi:uncharacterized membrane protein